MAIIPNIFKIYIFLVLSYLANILNLSNIETVFGSLHMEYDY